MKKVWVYIVIIFIVALTVLGMIFLSSNVNLSFKNAKIINKIINQEVEKINKDYPWVYDYKTNNSEIVIPYFNINNKYIKKINEDNLKHSLNNIVHANYVYSINDDVLSLLYTKEYNNRVEYQIYNINLKTSKIMDMQDILTYYSIKYDDILSKIILSSEFYLKQLGYIDEELDTYVRDTNNSIRENNFEIYIGNNGELYVLVNIIHSKIEKVVIPIIDKQKTLY